MTDRRGVDWPKIVGLVLAIPPVWIAVSLHSFFLRRPSSLFFDDGYTVALAERIIDGRWLPYVDGCSHRGPMLYWLTAIGQFVTGRFNWAGPRWLVFLLSLTSVLGLIGTGFAARMPLAGAVGALFFVWIALVTHEVETAFGVTGETAAGAFGVLALLCCTAALISVERWRTRLFLLALSGFFAGVAGFTKQTALVLIGPLFVWVLAAAFSDDALSRRQRLTLVIAMLVGFLLPAVIILGRYAVAGELRTFWYWFYTYNAKVYMAPYRSVPFRHVFDDFLRAHPIAYGAIGAVVLFGVVRPLFGFEKSWRAAIRAYAASGFEVTTSLLALAAFVAAASPMRFWPPYFLLMFPFLALAIGIRTQALVASVPGSSSARLTGQLVLGALLAAWIGYAANVRLRDLKNQRQAGAWQSAKPEAMCDVFDKHSGPDDAVFVWGFDADLLVTCHRHPATRYTYLTLVAGAVPPYWNDIRLDRVADRAREHVIDDLEKSKPKLILDMPVRMRNISLRVVPELSKYVDEKYCRLPDARTSDARNATIYARKDLEACKAAAAQPAPQ